MLRSAATFALPVGFAMSVLLVASAADAKARYMDLREAVATSAAIAVIHVEASAPCTITGEHWTYSQKVFAEPKEVLKGDLASPFELLAEKDFICASVSYEAPADYLVMLYRDDGHLTTLNNGMGALRIENEQVEWPYSSEDTIPLTDAVGQMQALIGEQTDRPASETSDSPALTPPPSQAQTVEPRPCGYAAGRMEEEETRKTWLIAGATAAGAAAVMLGFVFGFRRRRRS